MNNVTSKNRHINSTNINEIKMRAPTAFLSKIMLILSVFSFTQLSLANNPEDTYTNHSNLSRTASYIQRDQYRHPNKTLNFFEIKPNHTIVEIWPGSGWYTEILAPYVKDKGQYYAAHFNNTSEISFFKRMRASFDKKLINSAHIFGKVLTTNFEPPKENVIAPSNSADRVLTFRNVHNWMKTGSEQAAFQSFFNSLKPNGILGVVEHRAPESYSHDEMIKTGYVSEEYVKTLAKNAGFIFVASSEVNSNIEDNKKHPKGVWTLPPSLRLGDLNKEKYIKIGESDRMTLKFKKP